VILCFLIRPTRGNDKSIDGVIVIDVVLDELKTNKKQKKSLTRYRTYARWMYSRPRNYNLHTNRNHRDKREVFTMGATDEFSPKFTLKAFPRHMTFSGNVNIILKYFRIIFCSIFLKFQLHNTML